MAHKFTITDSLQTTRDEIFLQAQSMALQEIDVLGLDPSSKLKLVHVDDTGTEIIYSFELAPELEFDINDGEIDLPIQPPQNRDIAAASI